MTGALLTTDALAPPELAKVLDLADELKAARRRGGAGPAARDDLAGAAVGLMFDRGAVVARATFDVAVAELGATAVGIDATPMRAADPDARADAARALSGVLHALVVRTDHHARLEHLAAGATVPFLSAGSPFADPCQAVADLQTVREYRGDLEGLKLAYLGDGRGMANSLLHAGAMAGMHVAVASPPGYGPIPQVVGSARGLAASAGGEVTITADPLAAARDAHAVYTDTWATPDQDGGRAARQLILRPFQVGVHVMEAARPDALIMHPLPAVRGEEIAAELLDSQQSVAWAQAANLLHAQKALLLHVMATSGGP